MNLSAWMLRLDSTSLLLFRQIQAFLLFSKKGQLFDFGYKKRHSDRKNIAVELPVCTS